MAMEDSTTRRLTIREPMTEVVLPKRKEEYEERLAYHS